jgi:hypothetical protein
MNKLIIKVIAVSAVLLSSSTQANNEYLYINYNAKTGDTKLDVQLKDINLKAKADTDNFIKSLGFKYDVSTGKVKHLMVDYNFTPADAYMTLSISRTTNRSIHDVAHTYKDNKLKGWGYVSKRMGIKPGSREFHQLKRGMKFGDEVSQGSGNKNNKGQGKVRTSK